MADPQAMAQALLDELVARDEERGPQVAVFFRGELVIDAWSGIAAPATQRPVDGDTLFPVFSTTKGIVATVVHLLVERGLVDYDAPVARYWPEFAANGKAGVTVRHALAHTAGVPQLPAGVTAADLCDWDATCRGIAALTPLWEPGTATGYHALSYGWIPGEVARRADGRPFERIVRETPRHNIGDTGVQFPWQEDHRRSYLSGYDDSAPLGSAAKSGSCVAVPLTRVRRGA